MKNFRELTEQNLTLDPSDWKAMRKLGHEMMDDMMDFMESIHQEKVWNKMPDSAKEFLFVQIPEQPESTEKIYSDFKTHILDYYKGNIHPRFWSWVEGGGTPFGVLAEFLASTMNSNVTIGEHSAMYVDQQVINWCKQMLNFPSTASGILLSGGSMSNITALIVARNFQVDQNIRKNGLKKTSSQLVLYCSTETHSCIQKAAEVMGLGTDAVRKISVNEKFQINIEELKFTLQQDKEKGLLPFCVVGNAGTVNTGAIDPLEDIFSICQSNNLWFHVDGAFGALAKLTPEFQEELKSIEKADSVAFDLHKWMYMPYEVGCVLIKNSEAHRNSFVVEPNYLLKHSRGLAAGPDPINNYGLELSRGFKSLKVWMSIREHGIQKYRDLIRQNIAQAFYLGDLISKETDLELLTPVTMNIVCYRFVKKGMSQSELNSLNSEILMTLQEEGIASPSSTVLKGNYAIRVAITNHRSRKEDFDLLVKETIRLGNSVQK